MYYTAVGLEKNVTENRQTDREQRTEKPITEATLIPMDRRVEWANKYFVIIHSQFNQAPPSQTALFFLLFQVFVCLCVYICAFNAFYT